MACSCLSDSVLDATSSVDVTLCAVHHPNYSHGGKLLGQHIPNSWSCLGLLFSGGDCVFKIRKHGLSESMCLGFLPYARP